MKFGDRELASCTVVWRMFIFASSITGQGSDYLILDLLSWWDINSGSSLSTMSRCLRVPRSSVQMVVCWVDGLKTVLVQITPADSVKMNSDSILTVSYPYSGLMFHPEALQKLSKQHWGFQGFLQHLIYKLVHSLFTMKNKVNLKKMSMF